MRDQLDKTDLQIIRLLQKDGRMPSSEIAKNAGISEATVRYRLKKLIDGEFIQIVAAGNPIRLGFGIAACISLYCEVKMVDHVAKELEKLDKLTYITLMTSNPNIEAETYLESINELNELISEIEKIDGIEKMETAFIRKYVRERFDWGTPRFFEDNEE